MPLSLNQRKDLRDADQALKDALESIKNSTGQDYVVEIDFEGLIAKFQDDWCKNYPGDFFYTKQMTNFAYLLANICKDDMVKEAFVEATGARKITFKVNEDKKNTDYWKVAFEADGTIVILFRIQPSNLDDLCYTPITKSIPVPGTYTLTTRINLKENKEKFDEALEEIKVATGESWSYDEASLESCYAAAKDYQDNFGSIFSEVITNIAYNVKEKCKDDMVKEAFVEATPNKTIVFSYEPKQSEYWLYKFTNGNLVVSFKAITNVGDVSYFDFTTLL